MRFTQNFAFFKERHDMGLDCEIVGGYSTCDTISHSGAHHMGVSGFVGHILNPNWSAEVEVGYLLEYNYRNCDQGDCYNLGLNAPFILASAVYNTDAWDWGWLYAGAGIGFAVPRVWVEGFPDTKQHNVNLSVMPSIMAGYRTRDTGELFLDIGYRFSLFNAGEMKYTQYVPIAGEVHTFTNNIGWVMNHSISLGLVHAF